jgi:hypothetical protein
VLKLGQMVVVMKEIIRMGKRMEKVYFNGLLE